MKRCLVADKPTAVFLHITNLHLILLDSVEIHFVLIVKLNAVFFVVISAHQQSVFYRRQVAEF
jgi:hypothetical protein